MVPQLGLPRLARTHGCSHPPPLPGREPRTRGRPALTRGSAARSDRQGTPPVSPCHVCRSSGTQKSPPAAHAAEQQLTKAGKAPLPARLRPSQPRVLPPQDLPQNKHRGRRSHHSDPVCSPTRGPLSRHQARAAT
ncbi:hypothetical protein NDU88_007962 [Pleurodeles waltl]|uniref:Uncharacterized protein n=1 Tax=Pleurodeles waltl TaxID=8319 RepID=A0AAV7RTU8_PLEWA|nr:hypothetical protein NDU88_007962 [Pleurodeles waltl]